MIFGKRYLIIELEISNFWFFGLSGIEFYFYSSTLFLTMFIPLVIWTSALLCLPDITWLSDINPRLTTSKVECEPFIQNKEKLFLKSDFPRFWVPGNDITIPKPSKFPWNSHDIIYLSQCVIHLVDTNTQLGLQPGISSKSKSIPPPAMTCKNPPVWLS